MEKEKTTSDFFSTLVPIGRTGALVLDSDDNLLMSSFNLIKKIYQNKLEQAITFDPIPAKTYGNPPFQIAATASSGMEVTFTSSDQNVATIDGNEITIVSAGTTMITAHQSGDFIYKEAAADQTLNVGKADQLITFNDLSDKTFGDPAFTHGATASSGLPITYSTTSANVTITSNAVTLNQPGRITITASQEGNQNYNAAVSVVQSFCINPPKPIITRTEGFPITLRSSSQNGNQWYRNTAPVEDAVSNTLEVWDTGIYTVTTSVDGCLSEVSDNVDLLIVGIGEISGQRIDIYPNPVNETIMTNIPYTPNATIEILDASGKRQDCKIRIENDAISINAASMVPGLYLLRIQSGQVSAFAKVIKK